MDDVEPALLLDVVAATTDRGSDDRAHVATAYSAHLGHERADRIGHQATPPTVHDAGEWTGASYASADAHDRAITTERDDAQPTRGSDERVDTRVGAWCIDGGYICTMHSTDEGQASLDTHDLGEPPAVAFHRDWIVTDVIGEVPPREWAAAGTGFPGRDAEAHTGGEFTDIHP